MKLKNIFLIKLISFIVIEFIQSRKNRVDWYVIHHGQVVIKDN